MNPLTCDVYDKALVWLGRITNPVSISGSVRFNALGSFEFRILATDLMAEDVLTPGARIGISYRGARLMSGAVRVQQGSILPGGDIVFQVQDDWRLLVNTIAAVRPNGPIMPTDYVAANSTSWGQATAPVGSAGPDGTTQGQFGYYLWPDGSPAAGGVTVNLSESAIKAVIQANLVDRIGRPVTVAPDLGRGGDARAAGRLPMVRMAKVSEAVLPILDWSGLGLRLIQHENTSTIEAEVYQPSEWQATLTAGSGIVPAGQWTLTPPTATRSIVGGPGEDVARAFYEVRDDTGLEDLYGDVIEVFRDATGANLQWPASIAEGYRVAKYYLLRPEVTAPDKATFTNYLTAAGTKGLDEGRPTTGVQATLSETESFYFGGTDGVQLGDSIAIKAASGAVFTDQVTEGKFSLSSAGFKVEPILGEKTDDPSRKLAEAVAALAAAQRRLSTSR